MTMVVLAGVLAAGGLLFGVFRGWERAGARELVLVTALAVLLVEAFLNGNASNVPRGIFRPSFAGQDVRPVDLVLLAGLAARVSVRGIPTTFRPTGLVWAAFLSWYAASAITGHLLGNPFNQIIFTGKFGFYLAAGGALAAGIDVRRFLDSAVLRRGMTVFGALVAVATVLALLGTGFSFSLPAARGLRFGGLSPDFLSLSIALGAIVLLVEACRRDASLAVAATAVALLAAPFSSDQRASYLGLAVTGGALLLLYLTPERRSRLALSTTQVLLFLTAFVTVGGIGLAVAGDTIDIGKRIEQTFFSATEANTAQARRDLLSGSTELIRERPVLGHGLGRRQTIVLAGTGQEETINAHNILADIAVRTGLPGLALFLGALMMTSRDAWRVWRRHADPRVAALAVGCIVALAGLLAKGLVESISEKYRIAALAGLLVGIVAACAADLRRQSELPADRDVAGRPLVPGP